MLFRSRSEKRIADSTPFDVVWFNDERKDLVQGYLRSEAKTFVDALEQTTALIDGFESPFGMELLSTVDWLLSREGVAPTAEAIRVGLNAWRHEGGAARKSQLFDDRAIGIALERLVG